MDNANAQIERLRQVACGLVITLTLCVLPELCWSSDILPPNTPEVDLQIFPFAGVIGALKANAEICEKESPFVKVVIGNAEVVMKARYKQVGLSERSADEDEKKGYEVAWLNHKAAAQSIPVCAVFNRQVTSVDGWTARQGAEFIRKMQENK